MLKGVPHSSVTCYASCKPEWCYHPTLKCCYNIANVYPSLIYVPPGPQLVAVGRVVKLGAGWKMREVR